MNPLRRRIGDLAFYITQKKGTEAPYSGEYYKHFPSTGYYSCIVCNEPLFLVKQKFESSCGWPAFDSPIIKKLTGSTKYKK